MRTPNAPNSPNSPISPISNGALVIALTFPIILTLALALASCGKPVDESQEGTVADLNPYPNFKGGDTDGEKNFAKLINNFAVGRIEPTPWAGYWWPYTDNGIATGKYGSGKSPAGKYDAARGGQTRAQSWEAQYHGSAVKGVQQWWGHCNGWCVAAALFPEPTTAWATASCRC